MGTRTEPAGRVPGSRFSVVDVVVGVLLVGIVVWRVAVLADHPEPVGVDMANWVRISRSWWGSVDIDDVIVPPLVPVVAGLTNEALGMRWTSHLLMAIASIAPAAGAWVVVRTRSFRVLGVGATLAIALVGSTSAAMAWGGLPQLLGLGALMVFADRIDRFADDPGRRSALVAGLWLAVLAATSALVLVAGSIIAVSMAAIVVVRSGWRSATHLVWLTVPSLPLVPLYLVSLTRMSITDDAATAVGARSALDTVLGPTRWPWIVLVGVGIYCVVQRLLRNDRRAGCLLPLVLMAAATLPMATGEVRFAYVVPTAMLVAIVILVEGMPIVPSGVVLVALVALMFPAASAQRRNVDDYARLVPDGVGDGIAWLDARSDVEGPVLVPPVEGAPFGWMVEADGLDALVGSRDDWLFFPEERASSDRAIRLLTGVGWPTDGDLARIHADGIDWVFVPVAWGGHDEHAVDAIERECSRRVPYRTDAVIVLRTDDPCARE